MDKVDKYSFSSGSSQSLSSKDKGSMKWLQESARIMQRLNQEVICLALADDIVIHAWGDFQLLHVINTIKIECARLGLEVSTDKSAVMEVKRGNRKTLKRKLIYGFPCVTSYKYLGVVI